jgi:polysaccharide chain length determinant protein (PEP-CTERM system associated)
MTHHRSTEHAVGGPGPEYLLELWHRRKWVGVLVFGAVLAGAVTVTLSLPDLYRASATVFVQKQRVSEAFLTSSVTAELETRIEAIRQQVMSRARLTDLICRLNLYPDLRPTWPPDALAERMRRDVRLDLAGIDQAVGRGPTIAFTLSYSGRNPQTVAEVANTLVAAYVDENARSRTQQATRTSEVLHKQLADARKELDARDRQGNEFKSRHTGELPEQLPANLAALDRLATELRLNGEYQLRAIERQERLERQAAAAAASAPGTAAPAIVPDPLVKRRQELAELRTHLRDKHPDVVRLKAEIATLEEQAAQTPTAVNVPGAAPEDPAGYLKRSVAEAGNELELLKEQELVLRRVMTGYEARVETAPKRQQELDELSRDYATVKERYEGLLKRYEDAQLAESLEKGQDVEQFRVLDPAIPPDRPAAPNRPGLLVIGFIAALALAFAATVAADKLDTTFHTVEELRAFISVPALATIRLIPTKAGARRRRVRLALMTVLVVAGLTLIVAGSRHVAAGNEGIVRRTSGALR